jgi:hypothetical protein
MDTHNPLKRFQPACYRLRLQGKVTAEWSNWLEGAVVNSTGEGPAIITELTGAVRDQSALFGLLGLVRDLGVPLISVELVQTL